MSEAHSKTIAFRLNSETYFRLEAFAAEKGLSPGKYLKRFLESRDESLVGDIRNMKIELSEIVYKLDRNNEKINKIIEILDIVTNSKNSINKINNDNISLEILMILREISQPAKIASAQKQMLAVGVEPYSSLDN